MAKEILPGTRFGSRTATGNTSITQNKRGQSVFRIEVVCDCGSPPSWVNYYSVCNGKKGTCGCTRGHHKDRGNQPKTASERTRTHGQAGNRSARPTRLYGIWSRMRGRCKYPQSSDYALYGGRGIKVCDAWNDFIVFESWATANGYADNLTIDRINNDGNYEPSNCRWVTLSVQGRNTRRNHLITYQGVTKTLVEWSEILGMESSLIRYRIKHWGVEKAFTTPNKKLRKRTPKGSEQL